MNHLTKFWDFIDKRGVIRRIVLGVTIWMLYDAGKWGGEYASHALELGKTDAGVGVIVGAVTAPATLLAGYVFKAYLESRTT